MHGIYSSAFEGAESESEVGLSQKTLVRELSKMRTLVVRDCTHSSITIYYITLKTCIQLFQTLRLSGTSKTTGGNRLWERTATIINGGLISSKFNGNITAQPEGIVEVKVACRR